ncbi:MAG: MBL fold metallo-hydrolase [Actinomycetia bacterium]|nr:MBL fold metallo-hydrolase [Actinomycetes bacterium]
MARRRKSSILRVLIGLLALIALLAGIAGAFFLYQQSLMNPLPTGEVTPGIYAIQDSIVNMYLIEGVNGYLAIDAGADKDHVAEELVRIGVSPDEVGAVLLTHSDSDHTAGLPLFTNAEVYLSDEEVQMIDGNTGRFWFIGNSLDADYQTFSDGETKTLDGLTVEGFLTPGHTPGSMCYLIEGTYLFTGDSLSLDAGKVDIFNTYINMDNDLQRASLSTFASVILPDKEPEYLFTAHHGYSDDPQYAFGSW